MVFADDRRRAEIAVPAPGAYVIEVRPSRLMANDTGTTPVTSATIVMPEA